MSKATRIRQQNAREKIAAQRVAARRAEVRRRVLITGGSVVAVIAIVVAFILVKASTSSSPSSSSAVASAAVTKQVTSVPASVLNQAGRGNVSPLLPVQGSPAPLTANGKPEVLYMGAEYCPFCATERWAMTVALSRFGTFSGLTFIHSSGSDTPASIPTLTYYKSKYTSKYLTFTPVEMQKVDKSEPC